MSSEHEFLKFLLVLDIFISSSILKYNVAEYSSLGWQSFPFRSRPLNFRISSENSATILMDLLLNVTQSLSQLLILFLCSVFLTNLMCYWECPPLPQSYLFGLPNAFCTLIFTSFPRCGKISAIYLTKRTFYAFRT